MKTCVIFGDLSSDSASENYSTVSICDDCVDEDKKAKDDSQIVSMGAYNPNFGDTCEFCGKTYEEELQEN